jgi:hypothetical protein
VLAPPARGGAAAASSRGTWLQQRLAAQGAPGVGGPLLWLWERFDPAGPRRECQAHARLLRTGCAVPGLPLGALLPPTARRGCCLRGGCVLPFGNWVCAHTSATLSLYSLLQAPQPKQAAWG